MRVVALLLILNFWHMKQHEPLESTTIEALVNRLGQEPNNEELKEEIRSFDLLARKAYFTSRWQVKTGTWLLLFGGHHPGRFLEGIYRSQVQD